MSCNCCRSCPSVGAEASKLGPTSATQRPRCSLPCVRSHSYSRLRSTSRFCTRFTTGGASTERSRATRRSLRMYAGAASIICLAAVRRSFSMSVLTARTKGRMSCSGFGDSGRARASTGFAARVDAGAGTSRASISIAGWVKVRGSSATRRFAPGIRISFTKRTSDEPIAPRRSKAEGASTSMAPRSACPSRRSPLGGFGGAGGGR